VEAANRSRTEGLQSHLPARNDWCCQRIALMAATVGSALVCSGLAQAQMPAQSLWQTYMEAALASDQSNDLQAEAIILNAALAQAKRDDPNGQRPALSRLPLMLAYGELNRKDLLKPLADQGMHLDVSNLDERYADYVKTIDDYASSYYDRWRAHANDDPYDDFRQAVRFYGARNSYRIEVAIRTKVLSDEIGLADAMGTLGMVYKKGFYFDCAADNYGKSVQTYASFQQKRDAMIAAGARFGTGNPTAEQNIVGQPVTDNQVYIELQAASTMVNLAFQSLRARSGNKPMTNTDLADDCPGANASAAGFDTQTSQAFEYLHTLVSLTTRLHDEWPGYPFSGLVAFELADLYGLEFQMAKLQPGEYPEALENAKKEYERSLTIMSRAQGASSPFVKGTAVDYVDLLVGAKLPDEAQKIEQTYGVTPSKATN
jgi:hypothetical protein